MKPRTEAAAKLRDSLVGPDDGSVLDWMRSERREWLDRMMVEIEDEAIRLRADACLWSDAFMVLTRLHSREAELHARAILSANARAMVPWEPR